MWGLKWILSIEKVGDDVGISFGSCQTIFTDVLGMKRAAAKIVPKLLNFEQKQRSMDIAQETLSAFKAQSFQWQRPEEPRPKKACQIRSNVKVLLTVFFDCNGVAHYEFLPQGRMVNKEYYLDIMC